MVGLPLFGKEDSGTPVFKILARALKVAYVGSIRESPPQFENRIMARGVRSIMSRTMYQKAPFCLPEKKYCAVKNSSVACGFSPVKID